MLSNIVDNPVLVNNPIPLRGQVRVCSRILGEDNTFVREALQAVSIHGHPEDKLSKTGLLNIWRDKDLSFAAKCLVTLWWGYPDHRVAAKVYSQENLNKLSAGNIESSFNTLREEKEFPIFKIGLEKLYRDFSRGGEFHLNGIGVSFFTKFFHFYFASHPPKSNPGYLPVIADDIMRSAVFSEMIDRGEEITDVFYGNDASIRSYLAFVDRFNEYVRTYPGLTPFVLEDIVFSKTKGIGRAYVAGYYGRLSLPHWIAGRFNEEEQIAIVFNNLMSETYLFEGPTALLWRELLCYDYGESLNIDRLCSLLKCGRFDVYSFFNELIAKKIVVDHTLDDDELNSVKKAVNKKKRAYMRSSKGIGNFHASYESADNDYRNRIVGHGIPFAMSFELTYACNEACIHCYNPNSPREGGLGTQKIKPKGEMVAEDYFKILDSMANWGVVKIVFTGGDPFMKQDLIRILQYAHKLKFAFSIYTNGQALYSAPGLYDKIKSLYPQDIGLSLYSTIPEIHDGITRRAGSCEKTKAIARKCFEDAIGLQIKCPIMQANVDSYDKVYDFALSVNGTPQFDVNITSSVDGDCFASEQLRLNAEQMSKVLKDTRIPLSVENPVGIIERKPEMSFCGAGESSFSIQPDGTLNPCCAFPINCGNVKEQGFEKIWEESDTLRRIRSLRYKDSDICGKEAFCQYCNRCIGQSFVEHGIPENHSQDNCFIAKIRYKLAEKQEKASFLQ